MNARKDRLDVLRNPVNHIYMSTLRLSSSNLDKKTETQRSPFLKRVILGYYLKYVVNTKLNDVSINRRVRT